MIVAQEPRHRKRARKVFIEYDAVGANSLTMSEWMLAQLIAEIEAETEDSLRPGGQS